MDVSLLHISVFFFDKSATLEDSLIKLLLDYGAEPDHKDSKDRTALHPTVFDPNSQDFEIREAWISLLVECGADVNAACRTAAQSMHIAAEANNWMAVGILVRCGADINVVDNKGRTPIMRAINVNVEDSHAKALSELYKYGAQAPPPNDDEVSPESERDYKWLIGCAICCQASQRI